MIKRTIIYLLIASTLSASIQQPIQAQYAAAKTLAALGAYLVLNPYVHDLKVSRAEKRVTETQDELAAAKELVNKGKIPANDIQETWEKNLIEALKKRNYLNSDYDQYVTSALSKIAGLGLGALSVVAFGAEALLSSHTSSTSIQQPIQTKYIAAKAFATLAIPCIAYDWIHHLRIIKAGFKMTSIKKTISDAKTQGLSPQSIESLEQEDKKAVEKRTKLSESSLNDTAGTCGSIFGWAAAITLGAEALFS